MHSNSALHCIRYLNKNVKTYNLCCASLAIAFNFWTVQGPHNACMLSKAIEEYMAMSWSHYIARFRSGGRLYFHQVAPKAK